MIGPNETLPRNLHSNCRENLYASGGALPSVGHARELLALFPRFLFVPRDLRSAMIVRIADERGLLLCCA
jgi:hypothetical protein